MCILRQHSVCQKLQRRGACPGRQVSEEAEMALSMCGQAGAAAESSLPASQATCGGLHALWMRIEDKVH